MNKAITLFILSQLIIYDSFSQETFPRNDVKDKRAGAYAFTNATIFINSSSKIDGGVLLIREGKEEKLSTGLTVPHATLR